MQINSVRAFCSELVREQPVQVALVVLFMGGQTLSSGIGLLFLLPLLNVIGLGDGAAHPVSDWLLSRLDVLGFSPSLGTLLCFYIVLILVVATLRFGVQVKGVALQQKVVHSHRQRLFGLVLRAQWQVVSGEKVSALSLALTQQVQQLGRLTHLFLQFISQLILCIGFLVVGVVVSWQLSVLAGVFLLGASLLLLPLFRRTNQSGLVQLGANKSLYEALGSQLYSLRAIKLFAGESYFIGKMGSASRTLERQQLHLSQLTASAQWLLAVSTSALVAGYFYVALQVWDTPLAELVVLLVILAKLLPMCSSLQRTIQQFMHTLPASSDMRGLSRRLEAAQEPIVSDGSDYRLSHQLELKDITFGYGGGRTPLFSGFSVEIPAGKITAITGPSGVGKSTLADILAGLLEPDSGRLVCDGRTIGGDGRIHWRNRVAYVSQEPLLFNDTIRNNLLWVRPNSTEAELQAVLQRSAANHFVRGLPEGLDTVIGDFGRSLSGGQRQRLAIARALLLSPQLLILDEATNALDSDSERQLRDSLVGLRGELTMVVITHQSSLLEVADKTVCLGSEVIELVENCL